ncbi:collagen alpha-1(XI) chain-like [Gorilla gorilla gorilla]|uniref:collagen alpha-1(XI) chain-like n=1 Tax=Gorilla gorilla gorilla TaxID=9595 RepID=UPI00300B1E1E
MAEAGGLCGPERGSRLGAAGTGEAPPPPRICRLARSEGRGGVRGGEGELGAGTGEPPPGGRGSRRSSGRSGRRVPGRRPLRLQFPGPEPPRAGIRPSGGTRSRLGRRGPSLPAGIPVLSGPAAPPRLRTEWMGCTASDPLPGVANFPGPKVPATSSKCWRTTHFYKLENIQKKL